MISALRCLLLAVTATSFLLPSTHALDGTWENALSGDWATPGNWVDDVIAGGTNFTATFSPILPADSTVTVDAGRIIGNLTFTGDNDGNGTGTDTDGWTLSGGDLVLAESDGISTFTATGVHARIATPIGEVPGSPIRLRVVTSGTGSAALLSLQTTNTYSGGTVLTNGSRFEVTNNGALGSGPLVIEGGNFRGSATLPNAIEMANNWQNDGTKTLNGDVLLSKATDVRVTAFTSITFNGAISGAVGFERSGNKFGNMTFGGATANSYAGVTTIDNGSLFLGKTAGVTAVPGAVLIGPAAQRNSSNNNDNASPSLTLNASSQIADTAAVTLREGNNYTGAGSGGPAYWGPLLDLNDREETVGSIASANPGALIDLGASGTGSLTTGGSDASTTFAGILRESGTVTKTGAGIWTLSGASTATGTLIVDEGTLLVTGSVDFATVNVAAGATLGGGGAIGSGDVTATIGGLLSPGTSVGTLTFDLGAGSLAIGGAAGEFELGTSSDLVVVNGLLDLGAGTLGLSDFAFSDSGGFGAGNVYTLFQATSITGTLAAGGTSGIVLGVPATLGVQGTDLVLSTIIPEPASAALLAALAPLALATLRRRS